MAEMNLIVLSRRCKLRPGEFFTVIFPSALACATIMESVGDVAATASTVLVGGGLVVSSQRVSGKIEASGTNECDWTRQHHHNVPFLGLHLALGKVKDGANVVKDGHDFLAGTGKSAPREREERA